MDIASLVVALKAAVRSDDLEVISQARANLDIRLTEVKEFNSFRREVEAERQKQRRAEFETAVAQSHLMTDFVEEYVSRNLTSDVVPSLLKLNADIAAALSFGIGFFDRRALEAGTRSEGEGIRSAWCFATV